MAQPITLAQAQTNLTAWMSASEALATGQTYTIGGRSLSRADWSDVQTAITFWARQVNDLSAAAAGATRGDVAVAVIPS